MTNTYTVQSIY